MLSKPGSGFLVSSSLALFMVAMLVVGAELLFASSESIRGEEGLVALADPIQERFGVVAR